MQKCCMVNPILNLVEDAVAALTLIAMQGAHGFDHTTVATLEESDAAFAKRFP